MIPVTSEKLLSCINAEHLKNSYIDIPGMDWDLSETDLCHLLKPSPMDWRLRIRLWDLVAKAIDESNDYNMIYTVDITERICKPQFFRRKFERRYFASFLFRPIEKYTDEVETMLTVTRSKMWDIINNINPIDSNGNLSFKHANMLLKIHNQLVDRKFGAIKQLVEMKKIQLNINANSTVSDDIELLDQQIKELRPNVELIQVGNQEIRSAESETS